MHKRKGRKPSSRSRTGDSHGYLDRLPEKTILIDGSLGRSFLFILAGFLWVATEMRWLAGCSHRLEKKGDWDLRWGGIPMYYYNIIS